MLLQVSIPCYYSNEISINSKNYLRNIESDFWITLNSSNRKDIIILHEILKKSVTIKAAGLFNMDLRTFLAMIKSAYSVFTFFKQY